MVLIADNTERKMRNAARDALLEMGIPCAVAHTDRIEQDSYLPAGVIVVTERYLLDDVEYMSRLHRPSPIVLYNEDIPLPDFALSAYRDYCRQDMGQGFPLSVRDDSILVRGFAIPMTKTEIRIMRMLLCADYWESAERLALYCLDKRQRPINAKSIAVHICNINNKVKRLIGMGVIKKKRYYGYSLVYSDVK